MQADPMTIARADCAGNLVPRQTGSVFDAQISFHPLLAEYQR
jgi:hypothetical protein